MACISICRASRERIQILESLVTESLSECGWNSREWFWNTDAGQLLAQLSLPVRARADVLVIWRVRSAALVTERTRSNSENLPTQLNSSETSPVKGKLWLSQQRPCRHEGFGRERSHGDSGAEATAAWRARLVAAALAASPGSRPAAGRATVAPSSRNCCLPHVSPANLLVSR